MKKYLLCLLTVLTVFTLRAQVTIDGEDVDGKIPLNFYYGSSYSQNIYQNHMINSSGQITGIKFFYSAGTSHTNNITILLAHTTQSKFVDNDNWVSDEFTEVFSGEVDFIAGTWIEFNFSTPFDYNGEDNLVVAVLEDSADYEGADDYFNTTQVPYTSSLSSYGDNITISPTNPPLDASTEATNNRFEYLPHTQFLGLTPSDCLKPTNFAASNITENSATASWDASSTATSYRVIYKANENFNPANDTSAEVITTNNTSADLTLEPTTNYYAYVQAICSDTDSSSFTGPIEFETPASAADLAPRNVPHNQDFEVTQPLPIGWNIASNSGNDWEIKTSSLLAHSGEKYLRYFYNRTENADSWIFSIGINLEADKTYDVSFWQRVFNENSPENLKLTVGNAQTIDAQTVILWDNSDLTNLEYEKRTATFSPETDGVYYFAFHAYSPAYRFAIFVDDFYIDEALSTTDIDTNKSTLSLYPNPVKDGTIYLTTDQLDQQKLDIKLFNIEGKVVLNQQFNNIQDNIQINVQHLPEGKYFLQYSNSKEHGTIPVIIK